MAPWFHVWFTCMVRAGVTGWEPEALGEHFYNGSSISDPSWRDTGVGIRWLFGVHGVEPHAHVKPCEKPCKLFHVSCKKQAVPHVMSCKKTSCSTCHAMQKTACKTAQKSKLFHMSCKNHAKTMQNAARAERQPAEPSQSPGSLLYVLYVLYGSHKASH